MNGREEGNSCKLIQLHEKKIPKILHHRAECPYRFVSVVHPDRKRNGKYTIKGKLYKHNLTAGKTLISLQGLQIADKQHSQDEKFQMA